MHIPDGFLSAPVAFASAALAAVAVAAGARRCRDVLGTRAVARMGVTAAFVFAAQMINFPVASGTSGHLVGGVLAAILLGPSAAVIVMTAVLAMQCFLFGDGGVLSLGANVLNMAVVHPVVGFAVYRAVVALRGYRGPPGNVWQVAAVSFASWVATIMAAATCAGELALSGVASAGLVLGAMVGVHLAIGLGEALITALVVATILRLDPALLGRRTTVAPRHALSIVGLGVATALGLVLFVSPFASSWPDGLERVVERLGIEPAHARVSFAPLAHYGLATAPGWRWASSFTAAAATLLVFGLCCVVALWLAPRRPRLGSGRPRDERDAASAPRP